MCRKNFTMFMTTNSKRKLPDTFLLLMIQYFYNDSMLSRKAATVSVNQRFIPCSIRFLGESGLADIPGKVYLNEERGGLLWNRNLSR